MNVKIKANVPLGTALINSATLITNTFDPVLANNSDSVSVNVLRSADLEVKKEGALAQSPSEVIKYKITIKNWGPSDAQSVRVTDELPLDPKKIVFVSATTGCTL